MFFNIAKDLFKSIEVQRRSGNIQIGSTAEIIIVLGGQGNEYLTRKILRSKYYLLTVS